MERERELKAKQEQDRCTFAPKTNRNPYVASKYKTVAGPRAAAGED